uniref:DUF4209 domain-containing protein n=1 Tax=Timema poppense TaxID=170557 RepID=A0A7R9DPQ9_TIMPO|nr:unnamed protein product [Timema poppensis]
MDGSENMDCGADQTVGRVIGAACASAEERYKGRLNSEAQQPLFEIFLLRGETVPSLLRDLLATQELKDILGSTQIVFMQVLIGTPLGLNLRNIVWHGFPRPEEIKDHFVTTLLITVASIGELLESQSVDICQLPSRTPAVNLPECAEVLAGCFPNIHDYQEQVLELNQPHSTTWDAILQHYIERRFVLEQGYTQARLY